MRKSILTGAVAAVIAVSMCGCAAKNEYAAHDIGGTGAHDRFAGGIRDTLTSFFGAETMDGGDADMTVGSAAPKASGASGSAAESAAPGTDDVFDVDSPFIDEYEPAVTPQSGLLTGGEWNDNAHWADWNNLYETHGDWEGYRNAWRLGKLNRAAVKVQDGDGSPVEGARVSVSNWMDAVTDNKGMAYLFGEGAPSSISVVCKGAEKGFTKAYSWESADVWNAGGHELNETFNVIPGEKSEKKLDFMIMCDTTGSMSDELEYLKVELEDIVKIVKARNANIPTRVSVNFYRDEGDEYVVREFPFSEDIDEVAKAIGEQRAAGGGDFPEAVHTALKSAVEHDWDEDAVKIMFLVLDAPPHEEAQIVDEVNKYVLEAASMGIRIIPVASSGIDKSTEYLLRVMAQETGGTYTFLTSDSGVGGEHIEPTVGAFNVEKLKDMMIRIVNGYLE